MNAQNAQNSFSHNSIVLKKLSIEDAQVFDDIYARPELSGKINYDDEHGEDEDAHQFTKRMLWLCKFIYTMRFKDDPNEVVGSCVLYNWNKKRKEIYFGGSLMPRYWGNGLMSLAFNQMMEMAKYCLGAERIKIALAKDNTKGIKMAEKLGLSVADTIDNLLIYSKPLSIHPTFTKFTNKPKIGYQNAG